MSSQAAVPVPSVFASGDVFAGRHASRIACYCSCCLVGTCKTLCVCGRVADCRGCGAGQGLARLQLSRTDSHRNAEAGTCRNTAYAPTCQPVKCECLNQKHQLAGTPRCKDQEDCCTRAGAHNVQNTAFRTSVLHPNKQQGRSSKAADAATDSPAAGGSVIQLRQLDD